MEPTPANTPDAGLMALGAGWTAALARLDQLSSRPADVMLDRAIETVCDLETAIAEAPATTLAGRILRLQVFVRQARIAVGDGSGLDWAWAERELAVMAEGAGA